MVDTPFTTSPLPQTGGYNFLPIGGYWLAEADDVRKFRQHARNIVDYALGDRLNTIEKALDVLLPGLPQWDAEDKFHIFL